MAALGLMAWKYSQLSNRADDAARQTAQAWKFGEGILEDLATSRTQTDKLEKQREILVKSLGDAEKLHASLRREFTDWQQKHAEAAATSQSAIDQLAQYSQTLETSLGATQSQLVQASQTLGQERVLSQQQMAQLADDKARAEGAASALALQKTSAENDASDLDRAARPLNAENTRLRNEVAQLRTDATTLQTENTAEQVRYSALSTDNTHLREKVRSLEARIQAMEKDRDTDKGRR